MGRGELGPCLPAYETLTPLTPSAMGEGSEGLSL